MKIQTNSLILYKDKPCRVVSISDKLEIELEDKIIKVRPKDVMLLHPGPMMNLAELQPVEGDVPTAWELLAGQSTYLAELTELIYNVYSPATALATWQLVMDGLYFRGTNPNEIFVCSAGQVANTKKIRQAKHDSEQAWQNFVYRMRDNIYQPETDKEYLKEVELLAFEKQSKSRLLNELNIAETSENAHAFLLKLGHWDITVNPYPIRANIEFSMPPVFVPPLPDEPRIDLTHLPAFAIDDEDTQDPDDALSFDQNLGKLWVHVADVAAIVTPDSELDLLARHRVSNVYLPEQIISMLPEEITQKLALGLTDISPALSFGLDLDSDGLVHQCEIVRSWIRVTRWSYNQVEVRLDHSYKKDIETELFCSLYQIAMQNQIERRKHGAVMIKLPEVKVKVKDKITIQPIMPLKSRDLVTEAMLMAGTAAANFAIAKGIPFPFSTQTPPDFDHVPLENAGLAGMFALRKSLKRSELKCTPSYHSGLGLAKYSQVTSPLRRYLDLVAHQQLRAYLNSDKLLDNSRLLERLAATTSVANLRQVERLSRQHWTLVYLIQNSGQKTYSGVLVEPNKFLIPELDLEVSLTSESKEIPLNSTVILKENSSSVLQPKFKIVAKL